jgi:hypothetical protein
VSSAPCSVCGAFDLVAGAATRAAEHRLGAERLIIEQGAAEAVGLLPISGSSEHAYLVKGRRW